MKVRLSGPAFAGQPDERVIEGVRTVVDDDVGLARIAEDAAVVGVFMGAGVGTVIRVRQSGWYVLDDRPSEAWRRIEITA